MFEVITITAVAWFVYYVFIAHHVHNITMLKMSSSDYWWCVRNRICPKHLTPIYDGNGYKNCSQCNQEKRDWERAQANEFVNKLERIKEKYAGRNNN